MLSYEYIAIALSIFCRVITCAEIDFLDILRSDRRDRFGIKTGYLETDYRIYVETAPIAYDFDITTNCALMYRQFDREILIRCDDGRRVRGATIFRDDETQAVLSLAYDWISDLLYFTLFDRKRIEVVKIFYNREQQANPYFRSPYGPFLRYSRHTIINTELSPRKMVVHPERGYLFWTEFENALCFIQRNKLASKVATISRSNLDGTDILVLARDPVVLQPKALTLDYENNRIYWYDSCLKYVGRSDLNGESFERLIDDEPMNSIAVYSNLLFWHNKNESAILYTDIGNINNVDVINILRN